MADTMKSLEAEAAQIHEEMAKCHAMLVDVAKRRDALIKDEEAKAKTGGTVIDVPTATIKAKGH